ncbi:GrpB family protein [Megasphaera stantonii]|uniref:GrpB family protein n=1 Tax=Megasphaera stantonii TaxID=2144175 RepID=UPI0023F23E13|nr:GrpB family protein [Megasphaera stantonii]
MAQHIIVVDYDPCWEQQYLAEAKTIRAILGENYTAIFHIGSTAVRGLKAKPIIDIMPVVCSIAAVDEKQGALEEIGYEYLGEFGMAQRRYLRKGGDERTHQVHIFQETDRINIERHLAVRDFLRAHSEIARQYGALKESLARRYPYDIEGYCDGKDAFVKDLERQALRWKQNAPSSI